MRDPEAYVRAGRKRPDSAEQRVEHPYDFVSLPASPRRHGASEHERYQAGRLTGRLVLEYELLTPMHVGSGVFETAGDCRLDGGHIQADEPVRGIQRRAGEPVLPGSGWKGAVRSRYEAITRSRLTLFSDRQKLAIEKIPDALLDDFHRERKAEQKARYGNKSSGLKSQVSIRDPRLSRLKASFVKEPEHLQRLCPAEALFGCMGYRGRIHPGDGVFEGARAEKPLQITPLDGPCLHRLAKPGEARWVGRSIEIREIEGRKFYYDGPIVHQRSGNEQRGDPYENIDYVPAGNFLKLEVRVENLTLPELGALLLAAGHGTTSGILRFGGYKPAGLGKVVLREASAKVVAQPQRCRWTRQAELYDLERAVQAALEDLVDSQALQELDQVTRALREEVRR